jgi:hypothetical protein
MGTMKFRVSMVFGALLAVGASGCGDSNTEPPDAGGMCAPGQAGCACIDGTMCQGGLMCEMGLCRAVDAIEIEVTDVNARACEVIVVEEGATLMLDALLEPSAGPAISPLVYTAGAAALAMFAGAAVLGAASQASP